MSEVDYELEDETYSAKVDRALLLRIIGLTRPYLLWTLGFLGAVSAVSALDAYFTYLGSRIVDEGILAGNMQVLWSIVLQYGVIMLFQALAVFIFIWLAGFLGQRIKYDLRKQMFNRLQTLSFSYFDRTPVGWLMARGNSDADRVSDLVSWGFLDITWTVVNITSTLIFMFILQWRLALLVLLIVPILVIVASRFQVLILKEYRQVRKVNSQITSAYNENITGVRVVKALVREDKNLNEFQDLTSEMYRAAFRAAWLSALFLPIVQMISALAVGVIVWYAGANTLTAFGLSIGGIQAFVSYVIFMLWPIQELARVYAEMQRAIASAERIFSLVDTEPEIFDQPQAQPAPNLRGEIVFDDVSFGYKDAQTVLHHFNLTVRPGETIALVGATGAGKSTIVNLLCRFYEPTAGKIRIGGTDYTQYTLDSIHSRLGVVLQTPHLFSGTVRENLRYGRLTATNEEIIAAAQMAEAHEFISALEKGYDTEVGEGGVLLSTGQKQLISLARAILAQPDLLIMDEATSSVDTMTEALIQKAMERLMKGRTSFVIAHRLSTIRNADRILVLEKGRIAEIGSHPELLKAQGHYYRLYTTQFRTERLAELENTVVVGDISAVGAG
ncbi:MAG TPA: ABC transporter ATP-binding protein [Anaerolineales bacterium]|nr:ABC transporter ATP-binding protein [Anaerolineales bacterium]